MKECSLCAKTPRELLRDDDAIRRVTLSPPIPPVPDGDDHMFFRTQCPECSAVYVYSYSGEWDDTQYFTTVSLKRLSFAAAKLPPPPPDFRAGLQSPSEWVRRNAAWNLCELGETIPLLSSTDVVVREEALQSATDLKTPVSDDLLRSLIRDESAKTRKLATTLLVPQRIARGEVRALFAELQEDQDPTRVSATLWVFLRAKHPAVYAASAAVVPLFSRADSEVRSEAALLLQDAYSGGHLGDDTTLPVLALLQRDDDRAAEAAMKALCGWRRPSPEAVQGAVRWLPVASANFYALELLREQAILGSDLTSALRGLSDLLSAGRDAGGPCKVLFAHLSDAPDKVAVVRAMISGLRGYWGTSLAQSIDGVARQGVDLTPLLPLLRASVTDVNAGWMKQIFKTMKVE